MSILKDINFDILANICFRLSNNAIRNWHLGIVLEEPALLNHIIGQYRITEFGCNVGVSKIHIAKAKFYTLHRKGEKQIDKYGADLAVTISSKNLSFSKTAFFQFKKSKKLKVIIEKKQIDEAQKFPAVYDRSFVFVVDEVYKCIKIELLNNITKLVTGSTATFDCNEWKSQTEWLNLWLKCEIGEKSVFGSTSSIEVILKDLTREEPKAIIPDKLDNFPNYLPAKEWMVFEID